MGAPSDVDGALGVHMWEEERPAYRWTRTRAVLAAAVVLSTGSVSTLAAFTDVEYTTSVFSASGFVVESQTEDDDVWTSNSQAPGADLDFGGQAMQPGVSTYGWMNLRTTVGTTLSGTIRLSSTQASGPLAQYLEYRAVRTEELMAPGLCEAPTFTAFASVFIAGGPTQWEPLDDDPPAPAVFAIGPADDLGICFDVRIRPSDGTAAQGLSASGTWGFLALSDAP